VQAVFSEETSGTWSQRSIADDVRQSLSAGLRSTITAVLQGG
jgi:hypothetical protein